MNHLTWRHQISSGSVGTTPILSGGKLYMSTGWFYKQGSKSVDFMAHPLSAVEFLKDLLKSQYDATAGVYCLDAKTGVQLWSHPLTAPLDPAVINGKLYVSDSNIYSYASTLNCLDTQTGNTVWQKPIDQLILSPTIIADNKLYLGCLDLYSYQGTFRCYDLNGNPLWTYILPTFETMWFSAPAVAGGFVYFCTFNLYYGGGHLYCLNAATGQYVWSKQIFSVVPYYYSFQELSPVCAQGKVFAVDLDLYSYDSHLKCFNGATGSLVWEYSFGTTLPVSTPAVTSDSVFLVGSYQGGSEGWLYSLNPGNGTLRWRTAISGSSYMLSGSPVCSSDKVILAPQFTSSLGCFDQQTGAVDWEYMLENISAGFPSISDNWVYISDSTGVVYAFEDAVQIQSVSGGLLGVHAKIQNIGSTIAMNVTWGITVTGGALGLIDRSKSGVINDIPLGGSATVWLMPLLGIGKIQIVISVHLPNTNSIQVVKQGQVFGFLTVITS
jgi:outer membrane protein assembly factor BamB